MSAAALLTMLMAYGYRLTRAGDALRLQGPRHALTEDMRQAIRTHKAALLTLLTQDATPAPREAKASGDDTEEERAGISEYDSGLTRRAAEMLAAHGYVVGLPACARCHGMAYRYADGHVRCTTPGCEGDEGASALRRD